MELFKTLLNIGICIGTMYTLYLSHIKNRGARKYLIFLSLGGVFQFLSEGFRFQRDFVLKTKNAPLDIVNILFVISMLSIMVSVYYLIKENLERWNSFKFTVNGFFFGGIFCFIIWEFFLTYFSTFVYKNASTPLEITIGVIYFFFNIFTLSILLGFYTVQREYISKKINRLEALGFVTWFLTCAVPVYLQVSKIDINNVLVELLWTTSLLLISICAFNKSGKQEQKLSCYYMEIKIGKANLMFSLVCLLLIYFMDKKSFIIFLSLFTFRYLLYKHINVYEQNEVLVEKYREANLLLEEKNRALHNLANQDSLTKVFNRRRLSEELETLTLKGEKFSLLFLDLDGFKNVNDTFGHDIGDLLLIETVARMKSVIRKDDFLARQGGDEFVLIFKNIEVSDNLNMLEIIRGKSETILKVIENCFYLKGNEIRISASIGIACYPEDATTPRELLICGDKALYNSKNNGKNRISFY